MLRQAAPVAYVLFAWWFSTLAILYLVRLPRRTHRWTMAAATVLLGVSLALIARGGAAAGPAAAYVDFTAALAVWGWQEIAFLLGYITGPRRQPCPAGARGWQRACLAFETVRHHELVLVLLGAVLFALTWRRPGHIAWITFAILWSMRQSAKLNLFLGVRNLNEHFLPAHLAYLHSYFRRRRMNGLFPLSVIASAAAAVLLWHVALRGQPGAAGEAGALLAAMLLTLGLLEHCLMVLPLPSDALWHWGLRSRH